MDRNDAKEITWPGDPIAIWSIDMREAREDEDVERVEELLDEKTQLGPSVSQMDGMCFPVRDRREVQVAMNKSVIEIAKFHGFNNFDLKAVDHLSSAMANYMEGFCNQVRINRYRVYMATNRCNYMHAAAVTLLRTWPMAAKSKLGLRGLLQWYNETYRKPAIRADISARKWVEWTKLPTEERGEFVEPEIEVDEEKEKNDEEKKADEKEEDYFEMLSLEDKVVEYYEKKEEKGDESMDVGKSKKALAEYADIPKVNNEFESESDGDDDENSGVEWTNMQYVRYLAVRLMRKLHDVRDKEAAIRGSGPLLPYELQQLDELERQEQRVMAMMRQQMEEHPLLEKALREEETRPSFPPTGFNAQPFPRGGNIVEEEGEIISSGGSEEGEEGEIEDVDMRDAELLDVPLAELFEDSDDRVIDPADNEYYDDSDDSGNDGEDEDDGGLVH